MDTDPRAMIASLRRSHQRLASLAAAISPGVLTQPSYASEWSIAQVFSHLGSGAEIAHLILDAALMGDATVDGQAFAPVWEAWNAKSPAQQMADCLPADDGHISRLEGLSDASLAALTLQFFGMDLDAAGVVRLRLSEHAVHTWDIAVAVDPAAVVAPDAVAVLGPSLPQFAGFAGRAAGGPVTARLRGTSPSLDFRLEVTDKVTMTPWAADGPPADGEVTLPAEGLLRMVYGRLDEAHMPYTEVTGGAGLLGRLRDVFPGF